MNVSIVIPVYNEALELDACLRAISQQTVQPFEVIVVDNNSTDATCEIAQKYDFVTLLHETKQGVVHARTTGFNAAQGEIIGRIDADTRVPIDWVERVQSIFKDQHVSAASGSAEYYNVSGAPFVNKNDLRLRRQLAKRLEGVLYLWGANMALRKSAWQRVSQELCVRNGIHEDFDIGLHLQQCNLTVVFEEELRVGVSSRRIDAGYLEFMRYAIASPKTYAAHGAGHRPTWYFVTAMAALTYLPVHIMYRGYDVEEKRFTFKRLLAERDGSRRANPTTNVA